MHHDEFNRRHFHKLSAAALGGLISGAALGCGDESKPGSKAGGKASDAPKADASHAKGTDAKEAAAATVAMHACRGLNECKSQGKGGKNECTGQGACFTVAAHDCATLNDCKYQGGCGEKHGLNECKGQGGCGHFPIPGDAWKKARAAFEGRMTKAGKKVGTAPAPAKAG